MGQANNTGSRSIVASKEREGPGEAFAVAPPEVLLNILYRLDIQNLLKLGSSNSFWYSLVNSEDIWRYNCTERFRIISIDAACPTWKELYKNLESGLSHKGWSGCCLDALTNDFVPYPMKLRNILREKTRQGGKNSQYSYFTSICIWETLGAETLVEAKVDHRKYGNRFQENTFHKEIQQEMYFVEVKLKKGIDIAIPNHYTGVFVGPSIIGHFDPNFGEQCIGFFYLVLEDYIAVPYPLPQNIKIQCSGLLRQIFPSVQNINCALQFVMRGNIVQALFTLDNVQQPQQLGTFENGNLILNCTDIVGFRGCNALSLTQHGVLLFAFIKDVGVLYLCIHS